MGIAHALLAGISAGFALAFLIGPAFFALLQTSLKNGFSSGVLMAVGIFLSDLICVALAYLGASQFFSNPGNKILIGVLGGIILIIFGTYTASQKQLHTSSEKEIDKKTHHTHYALLKGFVLNLLNPFVFIYWIGLVGLVGSSFELNEMLTLIFFSGTLLTVLATDILKCFLSHKISRLLKPDMLLWVNRGAGVILIVSGIVMIIRVIVS